MNLALGAATLIVAATFASAATFAPAAVGGPWSRSSAGPKRAADPGRAAYEAAVRPGLGDSSIVALEAFLARYPRHPMARQAQYDLGLAAYARSDYARAGERFQIAAYGRDGLADEARYWHAQCLLALGRPAEARAIWTPLAHGSRPNPRRWDAAYGIASSWLQEGKRDEALTAFALLLKYPSASGEAAALFAASRLARELGREEDANAWRTRLVTRYSRSPEAASIRTAAHGAQNH